MGRSKLLLSALLASLSLAGPLPALRAAITTAGDVEPTNPFTWTSSTWASVGNTSNGTLTVNSGSGLSSDYGFLGYNSGVMGVATVDGTRSTWRITTYLVVGQFGSGMLNITNGATVNGTTFIGSGPGSTGTVTVDGSGSQLGNSNSSVIVASNGNGTLSITNGGIVNDQSGVIGEYGSSGVVTVNGPGSTWNNSYELSIGEYSNGTLNVGNGGAVTTAQGMSVASAPGSSGTINFNAGGGTLTTQTLLVSPTQVTGTGTINTCGLVSDVNLVFDSTASKVQTVTFNQPGQNVTVNLNMSNSSNVGYLGAGYYGSGSLTIEDGVSVSSMYGYLGYQAGSMGIATVDGTGSTWANADVLGVGSFGNGTLRITNGGSVSNSYGDIAHGPYSTSMVTVDGTGSKWTNGDELFVGSGGNATLNVTGGGLVTAPTVSINGQSLLAIDVGRGSSLSTGGGTITNNGTIRILAGAGVAAGGPYMPISASTWFGSGKYQAVGGTWNTGNHQFTASAVQAGTSGTPVSIDLASIQRTLITDSATGWSVGASFLAKSTSTPLNFTATVMGSDTLSSLDGLLSPGQSVLGGWNFLADAGYTPGDPAYLSFGIGEGYSSDGLEVWHYDGTNWTAYAANDLTYDGNYASFTVTGFSGYAVTTAPEPGTLVLLATGLLGSLAYAWRKRKS